jgi:peptide/nickel transport system substrate-binding protein
MSRHIANRPVAAALAAAALAALPGLAAARTPADTLVMAWTLDPIISFDPAQVAEFVTDEILNNTCDPLVFQDYTDPSKLVPGIAESWSASADGSALTFKLRAGLKHPSGNPVTAKDAEWSIRRIMALNLVNAGTLRQWGYEAASFDSMVTASDDRTLTIKLPKPYPADLALAALFTGRMGFVLDSVEAKKHAKGDDHANGWLKSNVACVGAYKLRTWTANDTVVLERNDGYWRGDAKLRRVIIRHVPESGAQRLMLQQGDADIARTLNAQDQQGAVAHPQGHMIQALAHHFWYVSFNTSDPILGNPKVREAFRHLINNEELEKTLMLNRGRARQSLVPIGAFGALSREEGLPFKPDIEAAKKLLVEAGYPNGFKKKLIHTANSPQLELGQYIQGQAAKVGIEIEIESLAGAQTLGRSRAREYEMVLTGWAAGYPDADAMVSLFAVNPDNRAEAKLTGYPSWIAAWADPAINKLGADARMERDPAKRAALYREIQIKHMAEGPQTFITQSLANIVANKAMKDIKINGFRVWYATATK